MAGKALCRNLIIPTYNMKKYSTLLLLVLAVCTCLQAQPTLRFANGKFKIAQFTDLHWMPQSDKCAVTEKTIRNILQQEKPDVAVLTGDIIYGQPALDGWKHLIRIFEEEKMPFIVTMGNHDVEFLDKHTIYSLLTASEYYAGSAGPEDVKGYGNCAVPIFGADNRLQGALYCMDSNDVQPDRTYGHYDWFHFNQIMWYRNTSARLAEENFGRPVPSLAFFHIPLVEYAELAGDKRTYGHQNEGFASSRINSGMFASFIDMRDVMGVFVGHDHDNDIIGINKGIALAFGRVTGADAYGDLERGARIIEMYEGDFKFDTWITTPKGKEPAYYYPSGFNAKDEATMKYLPARKITPAGNGVAYTYYEGNCEKVADIAGCKRIKEGTMSNFSILQAPVEDHFAYEFKTYIQIPERGVYRFYTYSDDGAVLYVDGQQVVNNDGGHSARRAEGTVALEKGFHELEVKYFEDYMGQELEVGFSSRNIRETVLPDNLLFLKK